MSRLSGKKLRSFIEKFYFQQIVFLIDFLIFQVRFSLLKTHKRSNQTLNSHSFIRSDTNEQMEIIKRGQDNMIEFVKMVPDEALVDLSHRWYCNDKN